MTKYYFQRQKPVVVISNAGDPLILCFAGGYRALFPLNGGLPSRKSHVWPPMTSWWWCLVSDDVMVAVRVCDTDSWEGLAAGCTEDDVAAMAA